MAKKVLTLLFPLSLIFGLLLACSPGLGKTKISPVDGMTQIEILEGDFMMGSEKGGGDAKPQHKVWLDTFWIDKTEITNAMYAKCVAASACKEPRVKKSATREDYYGNSAYDDFPVVVVSWQDADAYCSWAGRHLPTEAQWEKAARGTDERIYPWAENKSVSLDLANFRPSTGDFTEGDTVSVGSYPEGASPYGVLDMAGNVDEWVADWYSDTYYRSSPAKNPTGPEKASDNQYKKVTRGGGWSYGEKRITSVKRDSLPVTQTSTSYGFRCAE